MDQLTKNIQIAGAVALMLACAATPSRIAAQSVADSGRTLSLAAAVELAAGQSEAVRIAEASLLRARGQQYQARSQYLPQLNATVQYNRTLKSQFQEIASQTGDGGDPPPDTGAVEENPLAKIFASESQLVLGLQFSQLLFGGGRVAAQNAAANAARDAARIGLTSARAQLTLDVTEAYYDAVLSDRLVEITASSLAQTEAALRQASLARQVGTASEFEFLRAQVTRDNQRPIVIQTATARDVAYLRLKQLLNLPLDEPLQLTTDIMDAAPVPGVRLTSVALPVDALSDVDLSPQRAAILSDTAVAGRAPVRQAVEQVAAQRSFLRSARAQRIPSIVLTSSYRKIGYPVDGVPRLSEFFNDWTAGIALSVPLFLGGRIRGDVMVAEAGYMESQQQLQQATELAALDTRLALSELEEARAVWTASLGTSEQASKALTIAQVRYEEGLSTQLELTESRLLLQQAQANRARAARDLQVARVRLALLPDLPLSFGAEGGAGAAAGAPGSTPGGAGQFNQQSQSQAQGAGGFNQTGGSTAGGAGPIQ